MLKRFKENGSLLESRQKFIEIVEKNKLNNVRVSVLVKILTPEEAIGIPGRRDFPIIVGKERVIQADVLGAKAHVFTDSPGEFVGELREVLNISLTLTKVVPVINIKSECLINSSVISLPSHIITPYLVE